jgi:nicotinic acid mononucleotide adenylyltransferase
MAHSHGNEYQIRIVHEDGTEELSGWMHSEEQLAQATTAVHKRPGKAYWLRERNVLCPDCFDQEQLIIVECPITGTASPRYRPHDSRYLVAVASRNRYEILEVVTGSRR